MALNLDNLNLCPERIGGIYTELLAEENWFDRVNSIAGIEDDDVKFLHIDVEANLIPCCTTGDGTDTAEEITAPTICVKTEKRYCERDLMRLGAPSSGVRITAGQETVGSIGELLAQATLRKFLRNLSDLAFNGGSVGGNPFEGYFDLATNITGGVPVSTGNIFDVINTAYYSLPIEARTAGGAIGIFVGPEVAPVYQTVLMNKNFYHYNPGTLPGEKPDIAVPGLDRVVIIPVPALARTNRVFATPLENMYWMTNRIEDKDTYAWEYSVESDTWILRIKTMFGIALVRPDLAVWLEFDPAILTETQIALGVNIISPLGADGGVKVEQE